MEDLDERIKEILDSSSETSVSDGEREEYTNDIWWNSKFEKYAVQLPKSILSDMKERIANSKIKKQKLELTDDSNLMENFFIKEIERYDKKLNKQQILVTKQKELIELENKLEQEKKTNLDQIEILKREVQGLKSIIKQKEEKEFQYEDMKIKLIRKLKEQQTTIQNGTNKFKAAEEFILFIRGFENGQKLIGKFRNMKGK